MSSMTILSSCSISNPSLNDLGNYTVKKGESQTYKVENASNLQFKTHIPQARTGYNFNIPYKYFTYYNLAYQSGALITAKLLSSYSNSTGRGVSYNLSYVTPGYRNKTYLNGPLKAEPFSGFFMNGMVFGGIVLPYQVNYIYPTLNSSDIQKVQEYFGTNNVTVRNDTITIQTYSDSLTTINVAETNQSLTNQTTDYLYYHSPYNLTYTFNYHTGWLEYYSYTNKYLNYTRGYNYYLGTYIHYFNSSEQLVLSILPQSSSLSSHKGLPSLTVVSVLPPLAVLVVITVVKRKVRK